MLEWSLGLIDCISCIHVLDKFLGGIGCFIFCIIFSILHEMYRADMFEEFTYRDGRIREPWKHRFYCIASRDSRWEPVLRGCIEKICKGCIWEVLVRSCPSLFEIVFLYVCSHVRADILGRIYWRFIRIEKWIGWPWARALFIGWPYVVITWKEKRDDGIVGKFDNTFFIVDMIWHMKKGWKSKEWVIELCFEVFDIIDDGWTKVDCVWRWAY